MSEKRVVGIRGLDLAIYEQIQELARKRGTNVADVINEALRQFLHSNEEVDYAIPEIVSGQARFELTAEALEELAPLRIEDCDTVIVMDNQGEITKELVQENLDGILRVTDLYVPKVLYYVILKKSKSVGNLHRYDPPWREEKLLRFNSSTKITSKILERFRAENYRLKLVVHGDLVFSPEIPLSLFEEVVSAITVDGNMAVSEELYASVLTLGSVNGVIQLIDEEGKPVEQISYQEDFFTAPGGASPRSRRTKRGKPRGEHSLSFSLNPGLDALFDSIEEVRAGVQEALKNVNIEADLEGLGIDKPTKKTAKKTRKRVKPTHKKTNDEEEP